jgi:hypothetical protein
MLLGIGYAFFDGSDDITGFTNADTNLAALVTDDDDRPEAEFFTALDDLGDTANLDNTLLPF